MEKKKWYVAFWSNNKLFVVSKAYGSKEEADENVETIVKIIRLNFRMAYLSELCVLPYGVVGMYDDVVIPAGYPGVMIRL